MLALSIKQTRARPWVVDDDVEAQFLETKESFDFSLGGKASQEFYGSRRKKYHSVIVHLRP